MRERRRAGRLLGALSASAFAVLLVAPAVLAQTDEVPPPSTAPEPTQPPPTSAPPTSEPPEQHPPGSWGASSFEDPFDEPDATIERAAFAIAGTMRYEKTGPADYIRDVEVRVVDDPVDEFSPGEGCPLPDPVAFRRDPQPEGLTAEHPFLVEEVAIPCNGRYLVQAEGRLEDPAAPSYVLEQSFVLAVKPPAVTGLGVTVDSAARTVTATFQPLEAQELAPDALGYVLERSATDGSTYIDVDVIGLDEEPRFVDPLVDAPAGSYTYRIRAVRAGAEGDVRSSVIDTETDTVEVEGDPEVTTDRPGTKTTRRSASRSSSGRLTLPRAGRGGRLTTPTTLDTGFEDTLDYGAEPGAEEVPGGDEPVAGQSIVQDEADGPGFAVPAAGALVLVGWAGHILYLNRLAKQL